MFFFMCACIGQYKAPYGRRSSSDLSKCGASAREVVTLGSKLKLLTWFK